MIRPLKGETLNQTKEFYWEVIHISQDLISAIQKTKSKDSDIAKQVIKQEKELIKQTYADLKELQQWFNKTGKGKLSGTK